MGCTNHFPCALASQDDCLRSEKSLAGLRPYTDTFVAKYFDRKSRNSLTFNSKIVAVSSMSKNASVSFRAEGFARSRKIPWQRDFSATLRSGRNDRHLAPRAPVRVPGVGSSYCLPRNIVKEITGIQKKTRCLYTE